MFLKILGMFKENLIFGSNEDVIYLVLLWFLMILTKNMNQFGFNEDMRLLDDKKVSQVSQFDEMTSQTGVKYGYDNSLKINAGSLCSSCYPSVIWPIFNDWWGISFYMLASTRLCIKQTPLAFQAMHKRVHNQKGHVLVRSVYKNYYTRKPSRQNMSLLNTYTFMHRFESQKRLIDA